MSRRKNAEAPEKDRLKPSGMTGPSGSALPWSTVLFLSEYTIHPIAFPQDMGKSYTSSGTSRPIHRFFVSGLVLAGRRSRHEKSTPISFARIALAVR